MINCGKAKKEIRQWQNAAKKTRFIAEYVATSDQLHAGTKGKKKNLKKEKLINQTLEAKIAKLPN